MRDDRRLRLRTARPPARSPVRAPKVARAQKSRLLRAANMRKS